ncbi:5-bromo-4-chloroindolyl phosphate hydrolysis family protein [Mameliella alba]|nr:5-bromo-4-chloroindolyl phosphate hydrolysis family protein [Antarctobacter heliothermus]MBY6142511.1 5-bromo-4-chloroindolyl phosphate hydrolysis family protein [Mameliella alba]MCA0953764.1 5-bromo-4-chloroindolyl phosphate hydrolysis family protein [Mameliella alba]
MGLYDGPRQIVAGAIAAAIFLGLFFGATLVWWLALILAAVAYGALLLIIPRRQRADEIVLGARVSAADMANAGAALLDHAARLEATVPGLPELDAAAVTEMARHVRSIRDNVLRDPDDYRLTRRFISTYLPNVVQTVETYADLAGRASGSQADRLSQLGAQIRGFNKVVEDIDRACIENDLAALETEVDALGAQLNRRIR